MKGLELIKARVMANVNEVSISDVISATPDEVNKYRARFAPVVAGEVKDYNGKVEFDVAKTQPVELGLNQKKYFAFQVDDVEELLTNPARIDREAKKQAQAISRTEDTELLKVLSSKAGTKLTKATATPKEMYEAIVDANKSLSKKDAPHNDRYAIINYDMLGLVEKDDRFTRDKQILNNGLVEGALINGVKVIVTNTLPADTFLVLQKEGVAFARFLDKMETMRLQDAFADGVRGLSVFDCKELEKDYVVSVSTKATETK